MKKIVTPRYTFSPGPQTLNFAAEPTFNIASLYAVLDLTANIMLYGASVPGAGAVSIVGQVLTLQANTQALSANDELLFLYDSSPGSGVDFSVNQGLLYIPHVGANFGNSGPYANWVYLGAIPADNVRTLCRVQNISGDIILLLLDDATASSGQAPSNVTAHVLNAGMALNSAGTLIGSPGAVFESKEFTGRIQIYAPLSTAIVAASQI